MSKAKKSHPFFDGPGLYRAAERRMIHDPRYLERIDVLDRRSQFDRRTTTVATGNQVQGNESETTTPGVKYRRSRRNFLARQHSERQRNGSRRLLPDRRCFAEPRQSRRFDFPDRRSKFERRCLTAPLSRRVRDEEEIVSLEGENFPIDELESHKELLARLMQQTHGPDTDKDMH